MSTAEQIFEQAKTLAPTLQQEALDFVRFLAERQAPLGPDAPEFTSELMAAFAEAKQNGLLKALPGLVWRESLTNGEDQKKCSKA